MTRTLPRGRWAVWLALIPMLLSAFALLNSTSAATASETINPDDPWGCGTVEDPGPNADESYCRGDSNQGDTNGEVNPIEATSVCEPGRLILTNTNIVSASPVVTNVDTQETILAFDDVNLASGESTTVEVSNGTYEVRGFFLVDLAPGDPVIVTVDCQDDNGEVIDLGHSGTDQSGQCVAPYYKVENAETDLVAGTNTYTGVASDGSTFTFTANVVLDEDNEVDSFELLSSDPEVAFIVAKGGPNFTVVEGNLVNLEKGISNLCLSFGDEPEPTEDTVEVFYEVNQCVPNMDGTDLGTQVFIELYAPESNEETVTVNLDLGGNGGDVDLAPGEYDWRALFLVQGDSVTVTVSVDSEVIETFDVTANDCELGTASATANEQCVDELNVVTVTLLTEGGDVSATYVTEIVETNVPELQDYLDIFTPNVGEEDTFNTFELADGEYIVVSTVADFYDGEPNTLIDNQRFDGATCVDDPEEPKEPEPKDPEEPVNPEPREPEEPKEPVNPTPDPKTPVVYEPGDGDSMAGDLAVVSQSSSALSSLGLALIMLFGGMLGLFGWIRRRSVTTS